MSRSKIRIPARFGESVPLNRLSQRKHPMSSNNTRNSQITRGTLTDLIASYLYALGVIPHTEEILNIHLCPRIATEGCVSPRGDKDNDTIPLIIEVKKKREVKLTVINGTQLSKGDSI